MNRLLSEIFTILLILFSISSGAIASDNCYDTSTVHQEMIGCIQNEIARSEAQIKKVISFKSIDYGFPDDFYNKQRLAIHERCMLYANIGGQRGELLMIQCEQSNLENLDEYIKQYIEDVDNG